MSKRNPNGYGSVTKLSGSRTNPWMVRVTICDAKGGKRQVPIGYAPTEEKANILLAQYNNNPWDIDREKITLAELYNRWCEIKLPHLGKSAQASFKAAFKHCSKYYGMNYRKIKSYHMQDCIDNCGLSYSSQGAIKSLFSHLDRFAFECDIIEKMYSQITTSPPVPETTKRVFSESQIEMLWTMSNKEWVDTVLIFLYTGFRLNELLGMKTEKVNLQERLFRGGSKTASGKDRIVPIHTKIYDMVSARVALQQEYLISHDGRRYSKDQYYVYWNRIMKSIDCEFSPHETRHTFRSRLDSAGGNKKCIDLLMGHKSNDVGERVYTHKTLHELRETIELLK